MQKEIPLIRITVIFSIIMVLTVAPVQASAVAEQEEIESESVCPDYREPAFEENISAQEPIDCRIEGQVEQQKEYYLDTVDNYRALPRWLNTTGSDLQKSQFRIVRSLGGLLNDLSSDFHNRLDQAESQIRSYEY